MSRLHLRPSGIPPSVQRRRPAGRGSQGGSRAVHPEFTLGTHTASPGKAASDSLTPPAGPRGRGGGMQSSRGCLVPSAESSGAQPEGQSCLHPQHHLSISVLRIQGGMWWSPLALSKEPLSRGAAGEGYMVLEGRGSHTEGVCSPPGTLCCHLHMPYALPPTGQQP